jgi:hypothetical protein
VILRTASKHIPGQHIELSHGRNLWHFPNSLVITYPYVSNLSNVRH